MLEISDLANDSLTVDLIDQNEYGLQTAQHNSVSIGYGAGTLAADTFEISTRYDVNVFSGNGNLEYGSGEYDTINLSNIASSQIVSYESAADGEGVVYDPGNGARAFDRLILANETEILFEGIERIVFSDRSFDQTFNPNDPRFEEQWNLHMIGLQTAWNFSRGTDDVLIGVQDSGLGIVGVDQRVHPDITADATWVLSNNVAEDFIFFQNNEFSIEPESHGTAVQGIIAAEANNNRGIAGINWNSDVYNIDVVNGGERIGDLDLVDATQAMIDQATRNGQKLVINMSLEAGVLFPDLEELIAANQEDVLFVVATGNGGTDQISSPAVYAQVYDNVVAVGASWGTTNELTGRTVAPGAIATYSNRGEGITLTAPTVVQTTGATAAEQFIYDTDFNGTSAATPHVTGVASLVWSVNNDLTAPEVKAILAQSAVDLGTEGYDLVYGSGLVNADAAVRMAIALS